MQIDYGKKAEVLTNHMDIVLEQRYIALSFYSSYALNEYGLVIPCKYDIETAEQKRSFYIQTMPEIWKEAEKINYAFYKRVKRLKDKIADMLTNGKCLFLTMTFTDDTLAKTSAETRRQYIRKFLKQFDVPYIANIDFGAENGREHYHAILQCDHIDYSLYDYGAINGQKIASVNDNIKLAKYVSKLTNHAIKETTKRNCLIYSR